MAGELPNPPTSSSLPPLPPGWTEHKAPSGHTYFYNAATKESTYKRPGKTLPPPPPPPSSRPSLPAQPSTLPPLHQQPLQAPRPYLQLSDPRVANAFIAANTAPAERPHGRGPHGGRPQHQQNRPRHGPVDRPRSKVPISGQEPWILVYTKYGRRFVYNPTKNQSYWRIPEKLQAAILEMDREQVRRKALGQDDANGSDGTAKAKDGDPKPASPPHGIPEGVDYDSDEYEEVEVTDDEFENGVDGEGGTATKRQRTEEPAPSGPVEFSEADIAFQLQEMGGGEWDESMEGGDWAHGEDDGYEDDNNYGDGSVGGDNDGGAEEDGSSLFKALLDDFKINPFSAWEKLMEEGKVFDDPRYTALHSTKDRKAVWEEWSRERIQELKAKKATEAKADPKTAYFQLLQAHATPKLYWAEFKRKYRKEAAMRDLALAERDKEKWYREFTGRLKLPTARRKADLLALLQSIPADTLAAADALPSKLTADMRYLSLDATVRDPLVEAYIGNP